MKSVNSTDRLDSKSPHVSRVPQVVFLGSWFLLLCYLFYLSTGAPDTLPMRFNLDGDPIGFASKKGYFTFAYGFVFFINSIFTICSTPAIFRMFPDRRWNLPYRDYWFSKENVAKGSVRVAKLIAACGIATNLVMAIVYTAVDQFSHGAITGDTVNQIVIGVVVGSFLTIPFAWWYLRPPR